MKAAARESSTAPTNAIASAPPRMPRVSPFQGRKMSADDHDRGQDREAAEPGHGPVVQVAVARVSG